MARKTVLLDDFDGEVLPDDTQPVRLSLGRTTYSVYLSEDNYGKLVESLEPFIASAETVEPNRAAPVAKAKTVTADKEHNRAVRAWAQATGFKFTGVDGEERTLGDRGRIPDEIYKAYEKANG